MTESIPRVSIGIPVFNGENYLRAALDCLLAQTFDDFEVIISDNASTDGTEEICREYESRDARFRYLRHPENGGLAWNFNQAFLAARGEYFKWLAHDDLCCPTFVARSVEILDSDPSVAVCFSKVSLIDNAGNRIGIVDEPESERGRDLASPKPHVRYGDVLLHCVVGAELYGMIRSDVLRATGMFRPYCLAEKVLIAELALGGRIYEIPEELLVIRRHSSQYTQTESHTERAIATNPRACRHLRWPYRAQSTLGYLTIPFRTRLRAPDRLLCLMTFMRYFLQVGKWGRVVKEAVAGQTVTSAPKPVAGVPKQ